MPLFTTANARLMAARSVAARKAAEAERTASSASVPLPTESRAEQDPGISIACVRERLVSLDKLMAKAKTDREWDNLSRAYERMFKVWMVLSKTPGPGQRKLLPERRQHQPQLLRVQPLD